MASISGKIDKVMDEITMSTVKRFYPTYIAKRTELPLEDVLSYLAVLVKTQKLNLLWEVYCDFPGCCRTIAIAETIEDLLGRNIVCDMCGEEVAVTQQNIFPVFEINQEYKAERNPYLRSMLKKKVNPKNYSRFSYRKRSYKRL